MTYEQMKDILANPADYQEKYVEEAKKLMQEAQKTASNLSDSDVDEILANPSDYQDVYVEEANKRKALRNAGYSSKTEDKIKKYYPVDNDVGFRFNWSEAYGRKNPEQKVNPEDIKSLQKLDDFRKSQMWNVDDDVNLNHVASKLYFKNPEEKWTDFVNSDRFPEFQKYLEDVRKHQTDQEVDKIFNQDGSFFVDLMLPVSKQYAMKNYENMKTKDIVPALAADAAANVVMTGAGKGAMTASPLLSHVYANLAAPVITEAGNVLINDKDLKKAGINALEGYLVNTGTGKAVERYLPKLQSLAGGKLAQRQRVIDDAVNAAVETENKMKSGATGMTTDAFGDRHYFKWNKGKPVQISEEEWLRSKTGHVTEPEFDNWLAANESIRRGPSISNIYKALKTPKSERVFAKEQAKMMREAREAVMGPQIEEARKKIAEKINSGAKVTMEELRDAGLNDKESLSNFFRRLTNNSVGDYLTNMAGRPKFGQKGMGSFLETVIPGLDLFKNETESEKKSRLRQMYGL
jgi:hypothetical protein